MAIATSASDAGSGTCAGLAAVHSATVTGALNVVSKAAPINPMATSSPVSTIEFVAVARLVPPDTSGVGP